MDKEIDIENVAKLARLKLTKEEIKKFESDLTEVKKMFDELDKIDTNEEPCFHPLEVKNVLREDKVKDGLSEEETFLNAVHREGKFFKGPKV